MLISKASHKRWDRKTDFYSLLYYFHRYTLPNIDMIQKKKKEKNNIYIYIYIKYIDR